MTTRRGGPVRWWRPVLVIVVPVVLATAAAVLVLLQLLDHQTSGQRLDLIRTALAVGAGAGAVMTLVLGWRRQWSTEHDASERRLTELYVKAVEQLGSDKAAARHGALYALERVAQDNPDHRQTVVDVICAYLRGPYAPPGTTPRTRGALHRPLRAGRRQGASPGGRSLPIPPRASITSSDLSRADEVRQERGVRLTAQRILHRHLQPGQLPSHRFRRRHDAPTYWPAIDIDLTGAVLINFDLSDCALQTAHFEGAHFHGEAEFHAVRFSGDAWFDDTWFDNAVRFERAQFGSEAWFSRARFDGMAWFGSAHVGSLAKFSHARFYGRTGFDRARFDGPVSFDEARFDGPVSFEMTQFDDAWFDEARFDRHVHFTMTRFDGEAGFEGVRFGGGVGLGVVRFANPMPAELARFISSPPKAPGTAGPPADS